MENIYCMYCLSDAPHPAENRAKKNYEYASVNVLIYFMPKHGAPLI